MLTSINSATLLSESRQAPYRKSESEIVWAGIRCCWNKRSHADRLR
jgi:hypothetical protein